MPVHRKCCLANNLRDYSKKKKPQSSAPESQHPILSTKILPAFPARNQPDPTEDDLTTSSSSEIGDFDIDLESSSWSKSDVEDLDESCNGTSYSSLPLAARVSRAQDVLSELMNKCGAETKSDMPEQ
ncbi:uncharacterized protein EI90DRAFT_3131574 [Cantharellus anzutake]|uniref:uncharacterized protein n=1 Tax=Cantharellus anzutake TaxID=1750568 RepID=UPI001905D7B1|nr:uncharacterized protein EI90DRAFT_3131574 [Cantharellus anzutake]KAF8321485.1 hypothetical protein EI90DRAFT_3131574 [Cantharellus anzutake]